MKRFYKQFCIVIVVVLALSLLTPAGHPALDDSEIIYTALNNRLLPLVDACPLVRDGVTYVTYDNFNSELQCVSVYSATNKNILIYNWNYMLTFDLAKNTSTDQSGNSYAAHAISARGSIYVPVEFVCDHLGLNYTYLSIGPTVRICSDADVDSSLFKQTLTASIPTILKKYRSSQISVAPTDPTTDTDDDPVSPVVTQNVRINFAFASNLDASTQTILDLLDKKGLSAMFLVDENAVRHTDGDLIRRLIGGGHSVAIIAEDPETALRINDSLKLMAKTRTRSVYADGADFGDLARAGFLSFLPDLIIGGSTANQILRSAKNKLSTASGTVTLYFPDSAAAASALPEVLNFIKTGSFEAVDYK